MVDYQFKPKSTSQEVHFIGYPTATIKTKTEWITPIPLTVIEEQIKKELIVPYIMTIFIKSIALSGIGLAIVGATFIFVLTGSLMLTVPFLITLMFTTYTYFKYGNV